MTTDTETLLALALRVEQATGPDRGLDLEIARHFRVTIWKRNDEDTANYETTNWYYTASIDAAMSLVPSGWWLQHLGHCLNGWRCRVETNGPPSQSIGVGFGNSQPIKTAPLALTAACLRALAGRAS